MTLVLAPLTREDLEAVAAIEESISPQPWSFDLFAGEFNLPRTSRHWLVARIDETVVGFGGVMYAADTAHLMNVGVAPDHTRRGIAQQLCVELFGEARRRGASGLTLEVRVSNEAAIRLYHKFDMTPVGVRPGYYSDGEDAMIFWIHDLTTPEVDDVLRRLDRRNDGSPDSARPVAS